MTNVTADTVYKSKDRANEAQSLKARIARRNDEFIKTQQELTQLGKEIVALKERLRELEGK